MSRTHEKMAPTPWNNPILALVIDGPMTAKALYALSGLGPGTGRELGRLVLADQIVKTGDGFSLSRRGVLDRVVESLVRDMEQT